tara:strand:+ start:330 stop:1097 length:768 start_codon:yes stop_codon:yes gene_type:complete
MNELKENVYRASKLILNSKNIVVMTGAGISVDSGVPTFQGTEGLWARFGKPKMNAYSDFLKNPSEWWDREINHQRSPYVLELRKAIENSKPNMGHKILFQLENKKIINSVITQNIDGLHVDAGNKYVCEIHGNRNYLRCVMCDTKIKFKAPLKEKPSKCKICNGLVKYDSVMFGEPIPKKILENARNLISGCDLIIAIGTSSTVRPAAGLAWIAKAEGSKIIEINTNETKLSNECEVILKGSATEILKEIYLEVS